MTLTLPTIPKRLQALALTMTFVIGGTSAVVTDVVRHFQERVEQHAGSHVEVPGSCVEHAHRCDLGVSSTGHRFTATRPDHGPVEGRTSISVGPGQHSAPASHDLLRLPDSRAPPLLG